jgi:putative N6-adenine-specific DNA methylase
VPKLRLLARDHEVERVEEARSNLAALGFDTQCTFEVGDARAWQPRRGWNAHVLSNLPYGERIGEGEDVIALHRDFGALLRAHASGYKVSLLVGSQSLAKRLSLQGERIELVNGGLDVVLLNAAVR